MWHIIEQNKAVLLLKLWDDNSLMIDSTCIEGRSPWSPVTASCVLIEPFLLDLHICPKTWQIGLYWGRPKTSQSEAANSSQLTVTMPPWRLTTGLNYTLCTLTWRSSRLPQAPIIWNQYQSHESAPENWISTRKLLGENFLVDPKIISKKLVKINRFTTKHFLWNLFCSLCLCSIVYRKISQHIISMISTINS